VALYQKLFHELHQPAILYLALLLHDAGRAANAKAHDAESTVMADAVCRRLQIKGERRKMLLFLVDNHLLMYRTATTTNLEDPKVIGEFAAVIKSKEYLDTLLVMTYADSKGTSDASWSGYKEASIRQLYYNTLEYLDTPADFMRRAAVPLDDVRIAVTKALGSGYELEISAHFQHMPRSYFNFREPAQIAAHIRQFRQFFIQLTQADADSGLLPVMTWEDHVEQGYSEITVTCWDRHLLLARISGALSAQGINILSADLYQRGDHLVLDMFRVCNTNFAAVTNKSARLRVEEAVKNAFLNQKFDFTPDIASTRKAIPGYDEVMAEISSKTNG
jgi:[protein-PII] uridylyltransferase